MPQTNSDDLSRQRRELVDVLRRQGIDDETVLDAIGEVRRELFLPDDQRADAYVNFAQPIACKQTISQPYVVAMMAEALTLAPKDRVLEVGAGSGYAAAVMSRLAGEVFAVERHRNLADTASERLRTHGFENVRVQHGDGMKGWEEHAPYDAISVAAASPTVPQPLVDQLGVGGRLVMPLGEHYGPQMLIRIRKVKEGRTERDDLGGVRFVPLTEGEA